MYLLPFRPVVVMLMVFTFQLDVDEQSTSPEQASGTCPKEA